MDIERVLEFCLSLPNAEEDVKWEKDLTFLVGGRMFTVVGLVPSDTAVMSFKCTPGKFEELIEREGISPAPYVGRYKWVALENFDVLDNSELHELIKKSYTLVFDKLPKKLNDELNRQ